MREKSCSQPPKDFEAERREQIRKFEQLVDTYAEPEEVKQFVKESKKGQLEYKARVRRGEIRAS